MKINASVALDSWAVLAWIRGEPSGPRVREIIERGERDGSPVWMSWINAGEVYYMLVRKNGRFVADEFFTRLPSLPIRLVLPDEAAVMEAAKLKATRRISYADAFAAALAMREKAVLVTGDPEMRELTDILKVEWLGN